MENRNRNKSLLLVVVVVLLLVLCRFTLHAGRFLFTNHFYKWCLERRGGGGGGRGISDVFV